MSNKTIPPIITGITGFLSSVLGILPIPVLLMAQDKEEAASGAETTTEDKKKVYRVQVGAYSVRSNVTIQPSAS